MYSWRDREMIMDVLEGLTGNRVNYSCNVLGGVKFDVDDKQADAIRRAIDYLEPRTEHYLKVVTTDETMIGRTRNVGTMTAEQAERLGAVGPTARASGVTRDIRVESPYAAYPDFPVKAITATAGDLEAKFVVRLQELFESYRLIREILDKLPAGDLTVRVKPRVPPGETVSRVEAPRGELFYYLRSSGGAGRTASRCGRRASATGARCSRRRPATSWPTCRCSSPASIPCFSCNDRLVTIRRRHDSDTWTWARLRQYGIEYYR